MFEVRSFPNGGDQQSRLIFKRIAHVASDLRDDGVPVSQGAKKPINIAMLRVTGIVANPRTPKAICRRFDWHWMRPAAARTFCTAGNSNPMSVPMIAMTTSSSMSVNALRLRMIGVASSSELAWDNYDKS
jgi:hypothetical protein